HYVDLLNSPTWTDRNKAVFIMIGLTKSRDPNLMAELRKKALPSLKEMCLWPPGYSESAIELLGRIAGIPDEQLVPLARQHDSAAVIKKLNEDEQRSSASWQDLLKQAEPIYFDSDYKGALPFYVKAVAASKDAASNDRIHCLRYAADCYCRLNRPDEAL